MAMNPRPGRRIALETYQGTPIDNEILADPAPDGALSRASHHHAQVYARQPGVHELRSPTGRYNCHGLVLAARRTSVGLSGDTPDVLTILEEDGYATIMDRIPRTGDVAVYIDEAGHVEHTGRVSSVEASAQLIGGALIRVVSKWGALGEFEHPVRSCPFNGRVDYWRLG